jgi:hypothetical protein
MGSSVCTHRRPIPRLRISGRTTNTLGYNNAPVTESPPVKRHVKSIWRWKSMKLGRARARMVRDNKGSCLQLKSVSSSHWVMPAHDLVIADRRREDA